MPITPTKQPRLDPDVLCSLSVYQINFASWKIWWPLWFILAVVRGCYFLDGNWWIFLTFWRSLSATGENTYNIQRIIIKLSKDNIFKKSSFSVISKLRWYKYKFKNSKEMNICNCEPIWPINWIVSMHYCPAKWTICILKWHLKRFPYIGYKLCNH